MFRGERLKGFGSITNYTCMMSRFLFLYSQNYSPYQNRYHIHVTKTRGLYIFYPLFQCSLQSRAVNIADNLCTKQGNVGLKSAVYNQERFQIKSGL